MLLGECQLLILEVLEDNKAEILTSEKLGKIENKVYVVTVYIVNLEIFFFSEYYCFLCIPDLIVSTIITAAYLTCIECLLC